MIKVILDTNFLMIPYKFRVDIFSELTRVCNFSYKLYRMLYNLKTNYAKGF